MANDNNVVLKVAESKAVKDLVNFIRNEIDLDDLASLYSLFLTDEVVRIVDDIDDFPSDAHQHGHRIK